MTEAPSGEQATSGEQAEPTTEKDTPATGWHHLRTAGAVLAVLTAVPYALVIMVVPLDIALNLMAPAGVDFSGPNITRLFSAATCGILLASVAAAGAIGRRFPSWLVLLVGLAVLALAARWTQSADSLTQIVWIRGLQGAGAGAVLAAAPALISQSTGQRRLTPRGVYPLVLVVAVAVGPWAALRLPFSDSQKWQPVIAPYPWLLAAALLGAAAAAVASLAGRSRPPAIDAVDERANRFGWPLLVPAGIGAVTFLVKPQWESQSGLIILFTLLLATTVLIAALAGVLVFWTGGWPAGGTAPVVAVAALVLPVTATNAINSAIVRDTTWPLSTTLVLPALGGAALAGGLAVLYGMFVVPHRQRRTTRDALLVATIGAAVPLLNNSAATAIGTILVSAGCGLALGVTLRRSGLAATAWSGALFAIGSTLAVVTMNTIRGVLLNRALEQDPSDTVQAVRDSYVFSQRIWIAVTVVLLGLLALLVAGFPQRAESETATDTGGVADVDEDTTSQTVPASAGEEAATAVAAADKAAGSAEPQTT